MTFTCSRHLIILQFPSVKNPDSDMLETYVKSSCASVKRREN